MTIRNVQHGSLVAVPFGTNRQLHFVLTAAGDPTRLRGVPDGGHVGFRDTDVRESLLEFFCDQLQRKTGP